MEGVCCCSTAREEGKPAPYPSKAVYLVCVSEFFIWLGLRGSLAPWKQISHWRPWTRLLVLLKLLSSAQMNGALAVFWQDWAGVAVTSQGLVPVPKAANPLLPPRLEVQCWTQLDHLWGLGTRLTLGHPPFFPSSLPAAPPNRLGKSQGS